MPNASTPSSLPTEVAELLQRLGVPRDAYTDGVLPVRSPVTGEQIAAVAETSTAQAGEAIGRAHAAYLTWRNVPAPNRGELVRCLRRNRAPPQGRAGPADLAGDRQDSCRKALGEVQEVIDICEFAVGLSRQLYGLTIASERPDHKLLETWHPAGRGRHHLGLQLPDGGVRLERRAGAGLRQHPGLEAVGEDAAVGASRSTACCCRRPKTLGLAHARACSELLIGERATGEALVEAPARASW